MGKKVFKISSKLIKSCTIIRNYLADLLNYRKRKSTSPKPELGYNSMQHLSLAMAKKVPFDNVLTALLATVSRKTVSRKVMNLPHFYLR